MTDKRPAPVHTAAGQNVVWYMDGVNVARVCPSILLPDQNVEIAGENN